MPVLAAIILVLLGPDQAHELKYRFEKGMSYEDASTRSLKLELIVGEKLLTYETETELVMQRTVLSVGKDGAPLIERIEVKNFVYNLKQSPNEPPGTKNYPSHGKTLVWRKMGKRWGLYAGKGEVTKNYPRLVERLRSGRDARLPPGPVSVGSTWEVAAAEFLRALGQRVPEGVKGKAVFTLTSVEDGVAIVDLDFGQEYRDGDKVLSGSQKGVWKFDVANSRDLEFGMKGTMRVDNGRGGAGRFRMERRFTYPGDSPGSTRRNS